MAGYIFCQFIPVVGAQAGYQEPDYSKFKPESGPITLEVAIRDAATLLANEAEQMTRLRFGPR